MAEAKIRLFLEHPMGEGQTLPLTKDQAHYLFAVMRLEVDAQVLVFNGNDGEWRARVAVANKRNGVLVAEAQTQPQRMPPDVWLLFAPIKKERTDFIVEKAAELGATRILPVMTEFTNTARIKQERLQTHAVEAAEQCGGTYVPEVAALQRLSACLDAWPAERKILFCDEALSAEPATAIETLKAAGPGPWAVLIGPEGGFSEAERAVLRGMDLAYPVSLGPRILRADTAAVSALTLWQEALGDWHER